MLRRRFIFLAIMLSGCSTVSTSGGGISLSTLKKEQRIQLKVRTGNAQMDRILYEFAYQQFSDVLPLREKEPYTAALELTFTSATQSAFFGSSQTIGSSHIRGSGWYTGVSYAGQANVEGQSSTITSGMVFDWQNSTMLAVLRDSDGERLWNADYSYKGGWEISGWIVNTPEEAARLVTKRLKARLQKDFKQ